MEETCESRGGCQRLRFTPGVWKAQLAGCCNAVSVRAARWDGLDFESRAFHKH